MPDSNRYCLLGRQKCYHYTNPALLYYPKRYNCMKKQIAKMFFLVYLYTVDTVVRVIKTTLIIKSTRAR